MGRSIVRVILDHLLPKKSRWLESAQLERADNLQLIFSLYTIDVGNIGGKNIFKDKFRIYSRH